MAIHPFRIFQKNQKGCLAGATLLAMISFLFLGVIIQLLGGRGGPGSQIETFAKCRHYGQITSIELSRISQEHDTLRRFLAVLLQNLALSAGADETKQQALYPLQSFVNQIAQMQSAEQLINSWLITQYAHEVGITPDWSDVQNLLTELTGNLLSDTIYNETVQSLGISQQTVEYLLTRHIAQQQLSEQLNLSVGAVSPATRWDWYQRLYRQVSVEAAAVPIDSFIEKVGEPSADQLNTFFEEHKGQRFNPVSAETGFIMPTELAFQYVVAKPSQQMIDSITDEEMLAYYEANKDAMFRKQTRPIGDFPQLPGGFGGTMPFPTPDRPVIQIPNTPAPDSSAAPTPTEPVPATPAEPAVPAEPEQADEPVTEPAVEEPEANTEPGTVEPVPADEPAAEQPAEESAPETDSPEPETTDTPEPPAPETSAIQRVTLKYVSYQAEEGEADAGGSEEPATEEPAKEEPKDEEPATEGPKAEEPVKEEPKTKESATEGSKTEEPAKEEPKTEEPATEEPVKEEPKAEEPAKEEPKVEEPVTEEPKTEEPAAEEPKETEVVDLSILYQPFDDVKDQIRQTLAQEKATAKLPMIQAKMQEYAALYNEHFEQGKPVPAMPDLSGVVAEQGLELQTVPMGDVYAAMRSELARGLQERRLIAQMFLSTPLLFESETYLGSNGQLLYWITEIKPEVRPESIDEVKDVVLKRWKEVEARTLAQQRAEELAAEAKKSDKPLAEVFSGRSDVPVAESEPFTWKTYGGVHPITAVMNRQPPMLSEVREKGIAVGNAEIDNKVIAAPGTDFMKAVFALEVGESAVVFNQPQTTAYVVRLTSSSPSADVLWERFQTAFYMEYFYAGQPEMVSEAYEAWLDEIREKTGFKWIKKPDAPAM